MKEREFQSHRLRAVAINVNTLSAARLRGEDLWLTAREGVSMLCLSPEQLISKGFADLLEYKPFWNWFRALGVDEIHLLYLWGMSFRLVFQQIEFSSTAIILPARNSHACPGSIPDPAQSGGMPRINVIIVIVVCLRQHSVGCRSG